MDFRNLDHLFQITDPVLFIESCYQELLGRNISPFDLKNLVLLFHQGMNRHALIYCISKSEEFHERFMIENFSIFKKGYLKYKLSHPFFKCFCHTSFPGKKTVQIPALQVPPITSPLPDNDTYVRYQALSLCNISQLEELLENSPSDSMVISNPKETYRLLTESFDTDFCKFPKSLIFPMPSLPIPKDGIGIIWDKNWDTLTGNNQNARLFRSPDSSGRIVLYNNSSSYRKLSVNLQISSLENKSELFFYLNNAGKYAVLSPKPVSLNFSLYLKPFYNELSFIYIGNGIYSNSRETNLLKFFLEAIEFSSDSIIHLNTSAIGDGYFPYLLSDSYIRSKLHKNGFFEISAEKLLKSYQIIPLATTRYDYLSDSVNGEGYYHYQSELIPEEAFTKSGVILYTARRTGTLSRK